MDWYDVHCEEYFKETVGLNMEKFLEVWAKNIPEGGRVLDLGTGSGRDAKWMVERGFETIAIDKSLNMCEKASNYAGIGVRQLDILSEGFTSLYKDFFDGVWACASLLHLSPVELPEALLNVYNSLKEGGVLFLSFKKGAEFKEEEDGRCFLYLDEILLDSYLNTTPALRAFDMWDSVDERGTVWLNSLSLKEW